MPSNTEYAELLELAERCEKAEGPDRELDRLIGATIYQLEVGRTVPGIEGCYSPEYTASLDAALTLAPEGWPVFHLFNCHLGPDRWIWEADLAPQRSYADILRGQAATPALALCAASLRARASLEASDGQS